jgi:hypothetical protein
MKKVMISVHLLEQECVLQKSLVAFPRSGWSSDDIEIFYGERATSPEDVDSKVFATHYDVVHRFGPECVRDKKHLLVMENDCLFTRRVDVEVKEQLAFLDTEQSGWHLLLLGHISALPVAPVRLDFGLVRSFLPFESHCYILNYRFLTELIERIPRSLWCKPNMVEGWRSLPIGTIFSVFPNAAIQSKVPRAWSCRGRLVGHRVYTSVVRLNELLMISVLPSFFACVLIWCMVRGGGGGLR